MVHVVADTHAVVWRLTGARRLGREAARAFVQADAGRWICYVPAIVLVETALLAERGRVRIGPAQIVEAFSAHPGYVLLPLDAAQALEFASLPGVRDPMDRLLVAAARATGSRLVSADAALEGHGPTRVWD